MYLIGGIYMTKYLVILTAPSLGLMDDPYDYFHPYIVVANNEEELNDYIQEKLSRQFSLAYKVSLSSVETIYVSKIKTVA
jgi:hypothetical protein